MAAESAQLNYRVRRHSSKSWTLRHRPTQRTNAPHGLVSTPFVDTGTYPTRTGNHVVPWIDGEPAFRRICEAIELAQESVWATITFMWPSFHMPDGRGTALDVLERAAHRGVDVRLLWWRPDDETAGHRQNAFWGSAEHFELLSRRHPHLNVRWDRAHRTALVSAHCARQPAATCPERSALAGHGVRPRRGQLWPGAPRLVASIRDRRL